MDGSRIVTASFDKTARLWDAGTGAALATLSGHTDRVLRAIFAFDDSRIITASADNTARLWDAVTGTALTTFWGHTNQVVSAALGPDRDRIVTASVDATARVWQPDPISLMSADQRRKYVCQHRLIGAQSFSDDEMQEPLLHGREELRNPCDRSGPLNFSYYRQAAIAFVSMVRNTLASHLRP